MKQRLATIATALTLVGALFAGTPSAVRAAGAAYVAMSGVTYTGTHATDCNTTSYKTNGSDDNNEVADAMDWLEGSGTLYFCHSNGGHYNFTEGVTRTGDFTITGDGAATTVIDGGDITGLFEMVGRVTLTNLTLQHANSSSGGGALFATDRVDVRNAVFRNNFAEYGGGAIAVAQPSAAPIDVQDSTFIANTTNYPGGAIATLGVVNAIDSIFTNNISTADDDCVGGGGAIFAGDDVYAARSTFTNNRATVVAPTDISKCGAGENFGGFGGAILTGGLEFIEDSQFTHNSAQHSGGAIAALGFAPTGSEHVYGVVTNSRFTGNDVVDGLRFVGVPTGGNAIWNATVGLTIDGSTFINNGHRLDSTSLSFGAAVLSFGMGLSVIEVSRSSFTGNYGAYGGALLAVGVRVESSSFTSNSALVGGAIAGLGVGVNTSKFEGNRAGSGGAVFAFDSVEIANSTFKRNVATAPKSATGLIELAYGEKIGGGLGGAIAAYSVQLTNNRFTKNRASVAGGAIWVEDAGASLSLVKKNRFIGNVAKRAGGAIGFNKALAVARGQITKAIRGNRYGGNVAPRGPLIQSRATSLGVSPG